VATGGHPFVPVKQVRRTSKASTWPQVAKSGEAVQINEARELKGTLVGDSAQVVQSLICCPVTDRKGNALAVIQTFHSQAFFFLLYKFFLSGTYSP
jgi:hypothetical protein